MAGYYALLGRGPNLLDILQASGLTRAQREQREMQREQLKRQDEQVQWARGQQLAEATALQEHRRADEEFNLRKQTAVENEARLKREDEAKANQIKSQANEMGFYATALEKNPDAMPQIVNALKTKAYQGVDITDAQLSDNPAQALAMQLRAASSGALGAPKPAAEQQVPYDEAAQRVFNHGLRRGDPGFVPAYDAALADVNRERLARSAAVGGSKTLPTSTAVSISDIDTSIALLENLDKEFDKKVPNKGLINQTYSWLAGKFFPNSDVALYDKQAELAAQKAGLVLEQGKLQATDFPRYKSMTTAEAGNSRDVGKAKIRNTIDALKLMREKTVSSLGAAGYRTPTSEPQAGGAPTDSEIDAEINAIKTGGQ